MNGGGVGAFVVEVAAMAALTYSFRSASSLVTVDSSDERRATSFLAANKSFPSCNSTSFILECNAWSAVFVVVEAVVVVVGIIVEVMVAVVTVVKVVSLHDVVHGRGPPP